MLQVPPATPGVHRGHWTRPDLCAHRCLSATRTGRAHAVAEVHIADRKTSVRSHACPSGDFDATAAWVRPSCARRAPYVVWFTTALACAAGEHQHRLPSNTSAGPDHGTRRRTPHPLGGTAERQSDCPPTTPAQRTSPASTTPKPPSPETPPTSTKHHNRHHEPPGGPTTRTSRTLLPLHLGTTPLFLGSQHAALTPHQHPSPRPERLFQQEPNAPPQTPTLMNNQG